ncbi:ABC transporter ATP-binding protein [Rhodovulum marinum]|uniref:ABC-2 type transport system ATP-binding protein n=1 Tax=Rhodovulum marinum TaxID=320662 RepID=A0A4R2Q6Q5_9RHOB|nr:ABC transporter ATP-binding protein [Rhodovulum marinum]TCP44522.1 ABC-2 type transport system ATP-binding protein [Rhodovulum marinum]
MTDQPALCVSHVSLSYGPKKALDDVSFALPRGRFCALLGPNGAGKSTLFSLLTRLLVTREGTIRVAGHDLAKNPRAALARIGVVFQQPTLDLDMTVMRNMRYFAALHGLSGRAAATRIDASLDRLNMRERAGEKVRALNGGHRRRMEIARALVHSPEVLLLDEPTVGLDTAARRSITAHVHQLAGEGLTVLWATHLVDEIDPADEVVVLHRGHVLKQATAAEIAGNGTLIDAFIAMTGGKDEAAA